MTIKKSTLRARRSTGSNAVPEELLKWFSGETLSSSPPWSALLSPDYELLPERWKNFAAAHPGAQFPAGHEHLLEKTP